MKNYRTLRSRDIEHVWHPYSSISRMGQVEFPIIEGSRREYLRDVRGRRILDGISSWWCMNLGHGNRKIRRAIAAQARKLQNSISGGMSHVGLIELAGELAAITPGDLTRTWFASDGASSVEAAMRIALQYWWNTGRPEKNRLVSLEGGYHGDTLGCVGLGYIPSFHESLEPVLRRSLKAESPHCFHCRFGMKPGNCSLRCFESMERAVEEGAGEIAAVVAEPVCQGAAGMRIYPQEYVTRLRELCSRNEVLLILDEIAVGFRRTGSMFASDLADVVPDILCLGKGLTGGYLPMSAAVVSGRIYDSFRDASGKDRTFYSGHTFSGNPLCSAAALAAIGEYGKPGLEGNSQMIADVLKDAFSSFRELEVVHDATSLGCMSAVEISGEAGGSGTAALLAREALDRGLLIRPLGATLYIWPPLTSRKSRIMEMTEILGDLLIEAPRMIRETNG